MLEKILNELQNENAELAELVAMQNETENLLIKKIENLESENLNLKQENLKDKEKIKLLMNLLEKSKIAERNKPKDSERLENLEKQLQDIGQNLQNINQQTQNCQGKLNFLKIEYDSMERINETEILTEFQKVLEKEQEKLLNNVGLYLKEN